MRTSKHNENNGFPEKVGALASAFDSANGSEALFLEPLSNILVECLLLTSKPSTQPKTVLK